MALVVAAALLGPVALVVAVGSIYAVASQARYHWWRPAACGCFGLAVVALGEMLTGTSPLGAHFGGLARWWSDGAPLSPVPIALALVATVPLGVPAGVVLGAGLVGLGQVGAGGAEWHPLEQRRRMVGVEDRERAAARLLNDRRAQAALPVPPLGVVRGGDLTTWRRGPYAVIPPTLGGLGLAVVGASGSGKTVTIERLVSILAARGRRIVLADCKGSDPDLPERVAAAYLVGRARRQKASSTDPRILTWPTTPVDMWRGEPSEVASRLLAVQDFTEPYWRAVAATAVRLAVSVPDTDERGSCGSSGAFLARLDPDHLRRAYAGSPAARDVAALVRRPDALDGVRLRYAGFFDALAGRFDGSLSFGDADVTILTVPTLAGRDDAEAAMRMLLADFGHYCTRRKPRRGDDVTLVVDELSAVTAVAAPLAMDLAERVRDVGGQVIVSAQSYEGLGADPDERRRMIGALAGGVIVHHCIDPDELLRAAGTVRATEQSWQLEGAGHSGMGSVRMAHKMRVDPDTVRQAGVGEAWAISNGRSLHMQVIPPDMPATVIESARALIEAGCTPPPRPSDEPQHNQTPIEEPPTAQVLPDQAPAPPSFLDDLDDLDEEA